MSRERRKNARARKRLKVRYGESDIETTGFGLDISHGGLFLTANKLVSIGTRIHIHVEAAHAFYAEALVVRHRLVPSHLRSIEPQGMGLRFLLPGEVVEPLLRPAEPSLEVQRARRITCGSAEAFTALLREQLGRGVAVVPIGKAANHAPGDDIDFEILLAFLTPNVLVEAHGRVLQILENAGAIAGGSRGAVVDVEDARGLIARLGAIVRPTG